VWRATTRTPASGLPLLSESPDEQLEILGKRVVLVAAVAENGVIGNGPDIPWRIPGEQAEFKALTMGHTLVMGRTTFEAIGRPLPGRTTIVLTRDPAWSHDGVLVANTIEEALSMAAGLPGDVMVAGGGQVYAAALPYADRQVLTRIRLRPDGDVRYPEYRSDEWTETAREPHELYDRVFLARA
jgi:dihydrofolate reductase